jgi:hypothetical protein
MMMVRKRNNKFHKVPAKDCDENNPRTILLGIPRTCLLSMDHKPQNKQVSLNSERNEFHLLFQKVNDNPHKAPNLPILLPQVNHALGSVVWSLGLVSL